MQNKKTMSQLRRKRFATLGDDFGGLQAFLDASCLECYPVLPLLQQRGCHRRKLRCLVLMKWSGGSHRKERSNPITSLFDALDCALNGGRGHGIGQSDSILIPTRTLFLGDSCVLDRSRGWRGVFPICLAFASSFLTAPIDVR